MPKTLRVGRYPACASLASLPGCNTESKLARCQGLQACALLSIGLASIILQASEPAALHALLPGVLVSPSYITVQAVLDSASTLPELSSVTAWIFAGHSMVQSMILCGGLVYVVINTPS